MNSSTALRWLAGAALVAGVVGAAWRPSERRAVAGGFFTSLEARTNAQRANALRAAARLDGAVVAPGATFSFNAVVGPWTAERGYVLAPVSYDGDLVLDWGGGVCQTSTTLYNAALLAGMDVVERTPHTWAPHYVSPGRDAAVAQPRIDLRLRNPYDYPLRISAGRSGTGLKVAVLGPKRGPMATVSSVSGRGSDPPEVVRVAPRLAHTGPRVVNRGKPGARAAVYRVFLDGPRRGERELVSMDSYPAMARVLAVAR